MEAAEAQHAAPGRIVVLGASAGGVEALTDVVRALPADLGCPVVVVLHLASHATSVLPRILARATSLPVVAASDRDALLPNQIYVAVPDRHLLVDDRHVHLAQTPREHGHRPAVDPTMRTAARAFGTGAVGVVLSGAQDDGTAGLLAIKEVGGIAACQDPEDARYDGMPASAARHVALDAVLGARELGAWIGETCATAREDPGETMSAPTRLTCPNCGGVLVPDDGGSLLRYRCSAGHASSLESLHAEHGLALERELSAALRSVEDRVALLGRLAERARASNQRSARHFDEQARDLAARADTIRAAIEQLAAPAAPASEAV